MNSQFNYLELYFATVSLICIFSPPPLQSVAHVEAFIDFSEDENIEEDIMDVMKNQLENLKNSIQVHV
jgi:Predicted GTPase